MSEVIQLLPMTNDAIARYKNPDNDPRGVWTSVPGIAQAGHATSNQFYTLVTPSGRCLEPPSGSCWRLTKDKMQEAIAENRIWFGSDGNGVPRIKKFLTDGKQGLTPESLWKADEVGTNDLAKREITSIFSGKAIFATPKPSVIIERIVTMCTSENDLILDSFAGSGTTAHAVLNLNKADGGNRKFILVEMMDYAESITAERIKRVIGGYGEGKNAVEGTGGNFSFYDLGEALLLPDGNLNETVDTQKIRDYIWYMETKEPMQPAENGNSYYLGSCRSTAYYFYYEKEQLTTLDHAFLTTIPEQADAYLIYADLCTMTEDELKKYNITFKKIPRDIARL